MKQTMSKYRFSFTRKKNIKKCLLNMYMYIMVLAFIYTLLLCRGHSWRVRLAKQETLTPPGHLVSPLVCRGPWMSTVVLYCWCHSDGASVLLYFTLERKKRQIYLSHIFKKLYFRFCKPLIWGSGLLYLQSPENDCYSIWDDLSCYLLCRCFAQNGNRADWRPT